MLSDSTTNLIQSLRAGQWPRARTILEFGIDTPKHFEALTALISEFPSDVIEGARDNGYRLTQLVKRSYYGQLAEFGGDHLAFSTSGDPI